VDALYRSAEGKARVLARYRDLLDRWPLPRQELRVATREGETFVVASGRESAPSLILLHGSGGNSTAWLAEIAVWATHFRVYAIDLIGDAGFSATTRPRLDSGAYAPWLGDVLAGLRVEKAAFVGFSLGGWLAVDWTTHHPHSVTHLVLLSPGGIGRQRASFLFRMLPLLLCGARGRRRALEITNGSMQPGLENGRAEYLEFLGLVQQEHRRRMDRLPTFSDARLRRLTMPVLALVGERDVILNSNETCRRLKTLVPTARVVVVPGAGHAVPHDAGAVLEFIRR